MTFWPRCICCILNVAVYAIWVQICMIGVSSDNPKIGPTRQFLITFFGKLSVRLQAFIAGLVWVDVEYVKDVDYKKWLGPDWKPSFSNPSTIVSNHICWMDILIAQSIFFPSFVAKSSVRKYPFVGNIAAAIDCLFVDSASTKE